MKIDLVYVLCIIVAIYQVQCVIGVDVSQLFSTQAYACIKNEEANFAIIRGYYSYGAVDVNVVQGLQNAKNAGLITDIYMFPCRGKDPAAQVNQMMSSIPANLYGMPWIDVETNPSPGCSWQGHDSNSNCAFLTTIINTMKSRGKTPGIYASAYMWQTIFGSRNACPSVATQPLWYAHYDNNPSFADFASFGGWTKPNIKQFQGTTAWCGASVDKNYYP